MSRVEDVRAFYEIIGELVERIGGTRQLAGCNGRMGWPSRGVYFFFEPGEQRTTSGIGLRVVRVGTHALTASSKTTLWNRLCQHRGTATTGSGNHRGSVFRLLVGEALLRRDGREVQTWGVGRSAGTAARRFGVPPGSLHSDELPIETAVTQHLASMPFVWIDVTDAPGSGSGRGIIERNSIALLSNAGRPPVDPPSPTWLGSRCAHEDVRASGLWNVNHVREVHDPIFLAVLRAAARATKPL